MKSITSDEEAHKTIISINEDTMSRVSHKDETKEHRDVTDETIEYYKGDLFDNEINEMIQKHNLDPSYKKMDSIKTYGKIVKLQFCKEQLEEKLGLSNPPNIRTRGLFCFAILTEIILCSYIVILYTWLYHRDSNGSMFAGGSKETYKDPLLYLALCFNFFLPQIFIMVIFLHGKNENHRELMNLVLQISVVICFGLGWKHKGYGRNLDTDSDATPYDNESTRLKEIKQNS